MKSTITALACAALLGIAGFAGAQGPGQYGMSPEQYKAMQDSFSEFDKKIQPLRQQLYDRQAELDALYSGGTPNDAKAQALMKEIDGLDLKLQEARLEMRRQMAGKGIPFHGGRGPGYGGPGYGGGYGPGCGGPGYGGGYCGGPGYGGGRGWRGGWHGGGRMGRGGGCW